MSGEMEKVEKSLSQLKAEAIEKAKTAIEWAKDKALGDQHAAQARLAEAHRMPEDEPKAEEAPKTE